MKARSRGRGEGEPLDQERGVFMISVAAVSAEKNPQTLRMYEARGLITPKRSPKNTRLYSEEDLEQLETILSLTRDLGVNLAGVEIILNMRRKIEQMQGEVNEFMDYVKRELARGIDDWEQRLSTALVKSSPTDLVRARRRRAVNSRSGRPTTARTASNSSAARAGCFPSRNPSARPIPPRMTRTNTNGTRPAGAFASRT